MSLKAILRLVYSIVLVILILGGVAFWAVNTLGQSVRELEKLSTQKETLSDLQLAFVNVVMPGNDFLITGSADEKKLHAQLDRKLQEAMAKVQQNVTSDNETGLINKIAQEYVQVREIELQILAIPDPVGNAAGAKKMEEMDAAADGLSKDLEQLHKLIRDEEINTMNNVETKQKYIVIIVLVTTLIALAVGIVISQLVKTTIIRPLMDLSHTAEVIAKGDLSETVRTDARGEVGKLVAAFNGMVGNLKNLITNIMEAARNVAVTSKELSSNSDEVAKATQQVAGAIQEVAKGASEQTRFATDTVEIVGQVNNALRQISAGAQEQVINVTTTADMVGQMATSIQEVASSAQTVAISAEKTKGAADKGGKAVELTIKGMAGIKNKVFETAIKIKELGEHSQQIGEIIQVIDDIAEQTNLLALNAAIEAARAGEHGKGFAVVADEVRKLAERSGKATKEIAELITDIQKLTAGAVTAMEQGTGEVEQGAGLALDAGNALKEILVMVEETYRQVQNISAAAEQISASSQEVVKAIDNVSAITQENTAATEELTAAGSQVATAMENISAVTRESSAAAEEVSASTEQMTASIEEIASSTQALADTADKLNGLVSRFVLEKS